MIEGIVLGIASWLSLMLSWWHLPESMKNFTRRHPLLSDISSAIFIYSTLSVFSKSLVAVIGATIAGLLVNFTIMFAGKMK